MRANMRECECVCACGQWQRENRSKKMIITVIDYMYTMGLTSRE